jgi:hypothetical protein
MLASEDRPLTCFTVPPTAFQKLGVGISRLIYGKREQKRVERKENSTRKAPPMSKAISYPDVKQPPSLDLTPKGCDLI